MPRSKEKTKGKVKQKPVAVNAGTRKLGGVTGKGFMPGQSGNPAGRPKKLISLISEALREKLRTMSQDGVRTYAEVLADRLVTEAEMGALPVQAIKEIVDRVEGKPKQQIDVNDVTDKFSGRTKEELSYFAQHGKFPDAQG